MMINVLLNVQKGDMGPLRRVQDIFQGRIQGNHLASLQVVGRHILVDALSHLRTRDLLIRRQTQKGPQLLRNLQRLVETVVRSPRLGLLARRVLQERLHLAQILAQSLDFRLKSQKQFVGRLH